MENPCGAKGVASGGAVTSSITLYIMAIWIDAPAGHSLLLC